MKRMFEKSAEANSGGGEDEAEEDCEGDVLGLPPKIPGDSKTKKLGTCKTMMGIVESGFGKKC
ncbi:hypothetical protein QJS04_geneDACA009099 [Acorus gramineus]|uniref:Uncharacterized protein n=1 Tax=Acorus gramineus TaxID=55184 RepID=A0AAV9AQJ1_ACOGR|nr:hypothetical protein QJS04_geneDACA009099 [Acorus gramineus]